MSKYFFQKVGLSEIRGNVIFQRFDLAVQGLYWSMRTQVNDQTWKDGTFPLGAASKATVQDVMDLHSDGTQARDKWVMKSLDRLERTGLISISKSQVVKLSTFIDEQNLGNSEALRKRNVAEDELQGLVSKAAVSLKELFVQSRAQALPYEVLENHIKGTGRLFAGRKIYTAKAQEILDRLCLSGKLCVGDNGLYRLAPLASPPEAEAGIADTGAEHSGSRNIPLESELYSESEKEGLTSLSADSADTRPLCSVEQQRVPASGAEGGEASGASSFIRPLGADDPIVYHEDAMTHPHPVDAAIRWLSERPGWDEYSDGKKRAPSKRVLLNKWKALCEELGPQVATQIWRQALFDIMLDKRSGSSWKSYVAGFVQKLNIAHEARDSLAEVEG